MGYFIAWTLVYIGGLCLIALSVYALRRRPVVAFWLASVGVIWMLIPYPIDPDHTAPLCVVVLFRVFLETGADAAVPLTFATITTGAVTAVSLMWLALGQIYRRRPIFEVWRAWLTDRFHRDR